MSRATCDVSATSDVVLVCIADDDLRRDVTTGLRGEWPVRTAYDGHTACESLDEAVSVVVVDLTDDVFDVDKTLECREDGGMAFETAALVEHRSQGDDRLDDHVHKPVSNDELHATVERLHRRVQYDRVLGCYYTVASEYAEAASGEHHDPSELARLQERLFTMRKRLDEIADGLNDVDAFDAALEEYDDSDDFSLR